MVYAAWSEEGDTSLPGALVISLDFELHWGVRDVYPGTGSYIQNLLGARDAIPRLLDLFVEHDVAATWATVGFLMAECRDELESFHPVVRPNYRDRNLDPYSEPVGWDERSDPLHYALSLIRLIDSAPKQEIGTHTYSHFYCLEEGGGAEAFRQDIASALAIARAKGLELKSLVLPRNQWNLEYASILLDAGIECYRGPQPGWMYSATPKGKQTLVKRLGRLVDAHMAFRGWDGIAWRDVIEGSPLRDIGATCFLRPVNGSSRRLNDVRLRRITSAMTRAAHERRIFHLWWHPHNFGIRTAENLRFLRRVLEHFRALRDEAGMCSLSMIEVSRCAARLSAEEGAGRNA